MRKLAVLQNPCLLVPTIVASGRFRPRVARAALTPSAGGMLAGLGRGPDAEAHL
ncbi:MAG: hypothetical protein VKI42_07850 [Synechococcaceae cyanobacterium]|nr:hypothetical protein [Synechococcaceae cyanobacterium]